MQSAVRWIGKLAFCLLLTWGAYRSAAMLDPRYGIVGALPTLFVWAHLFAGDILHLLLGVKRKAERDALEPWHGRYYQFDRHHLRFYFHADTVWIPLKDLKPLLIPALAERELRLLGNDYVRLPEIREMAISEAGLHVLLKQRTEHRRSHYQMIRFKRWLNHEVLPNVRRLPRSAASGNP